jgi:membrane protease YdiL (CAAX protease family)
MTTARRIQIVIGLLIALGLPFCHLGDLGKRILGPSNPLAGEVLWWVLFVVILAYVLVVERKTLASIGYKRPGVTDIALGIGAAVVSFLIAGVLFQFVLPALHLGMTRQINNIALAPLWLRLMLVTRAAFVEETAFRGFGFERLSELTGSPFLAGLVTLVLFTLAHLSGGGWGQVIIAACAGLILTLLYMWRRNIWANIIAHWLTDGTAFIILPLLTSGAH